MLKCYNIMRAISFSVPEIICQHLLNASYVQDISLSARQNSGHILVFNLWSVCEGHKYIRR